MPKVVETQFYLPPGRSALLYGMVTVPCAFLGNMVGEYQTDIVSNKTLYRRTSQKRPPKTAKIHGRLRVIIAYERSQIQ